MDGIQLGNLLQTNIAKVTSGTTFDDPSALAQHVMWQFGESITQAMGVMPIVSGSFTVSGTFIVNQNGLYVSPTSASGRVGINTASPDSALTIVDHNNSPLKIYEYSTADGTTIRGYHARGSQGNPSEAHSGDVLMGMRSFGYGTTGWNGVSAGIDLHASQDYTDSVNGSYIRFRATPTGSNAISEIVKMIDSKVYVRGDLDVSGAISGSTINAGTLNASTLSLSGGGLGLNNLSLTEYTDYSWDISGHMCFEWPLLEQAGTSLVYDTAGSHNLTMNSIDAGDWGEDEYGGYLNLDGTAEYLSFADNADFEPGTGAFYVCGMFNSDDGGDGPLFSKEDYDDATNRFGMYLVISGASEGKIGLNYGTVQGALSTNAVASHGTLYFYLICGDGAGTPKLDVYVQQITDSAFNTTAVAGLSQLTYASLGVNDSTFRIGFDRNVAGTDLLYFDGKIYRHCFCKGKTLTTNEKKALFLEYKNASYKKRGLDYSSFTNDTVLPAAESGVNKLVSITDDQIYARETTGIQKVSGGIKIGLLNAGNSGANWDANFIQAARYTALQDAIVTHLFVNPYNTTAGTKMVMAIYSDAPGVAGGAQCHAPYAKLVQTVEYTLKESDQGGTIIIPLTAPYEIKFGQNYWIACTSDTQIQIFYGDSGYNNGCYRSLAYNATMPDPFGATITYCGHFCCGGI